MSVEKIDIASEVAALKFRTGSFDVWKKTNLLREPIFIHAVLIIALYGIGNAVVQILFKTNHISFSLKEASYPLLYLSPILGGLYIAGGLNRHSVCISVVYMFLYALFEYVISQYFHSIQSIVGIFQFIPGCALIVWWIVTKPEIMGKLGMKKSDSLTVSLYAFILILIIASYAAHLLIVYGFKLEFRPVEMAAYFLGNFITCLFVTSYCFGMWNLLKKRGANTFQGILALMALFGLIEAPVMIAFALIGIASPAMAVAGIVLNLMLTLTVMHFSFSALKNSLTATFLLAMVMLLLKAAGVF
ncbi:MAG: hypothetical protein WCX65_00460 [bacterium]